MKRILLALTLVAAVSGIAYASAVYLTINTNGGASLSGEASTKKAALRCFMQQWPFLTYSCPNGEVCNIAGGSSVNPFPWTVNVTSCIGTSPRQCDVKLNGSGFSNAHMLFEYTQGGNISRTWTYGAPGAKQSECNISQHRLEQFFLPPQS